MKWESSHHSANSTDEYLFHQVIPYIGNKRKLLELIHEALIAANIQPETHEFLDLFSGTGVVSRFARQHGFAVIANDWEPYSEMINRCYLELSAPPLFFDKRSYQEVLGNLNALAARQDWVTEHLCPRDDGTFDIQKDRLFYMRKNGQRIDAIRHQIDVWERAGELTLHQKAALLAPLLYQCCYNANTSGVFKGFHNGWGGQTKTALYRIMGDLVLRPALFWDNGRQSRVTRMDAQSLAEELETTTSRRLFAYLDPPYNQHPYGANYHVLNSVALWDKPALSPTISGHGNKAAIRTDWRTQRRSAYNYRAEAAAAYAKLLSTLAGKTEWIATSYSTEGMIPLAAIIDLNLACGDTQVFAQPYKRYRVSSQRRSAKPSTVEFILLTRCGAAPHQTAAVLLDKILSQSA